MMLPVLFFLLCATLAESLNEGDSCSLTNGRPGICAFLKNCQSEIDELLAGSTPDKICGYDAGKVEPIICCPTNSVNITTPRPVVRPGVQGDRRGAIARQKCAEYSQSVYVLKDKPTLAGDHQRVNVSQCVLEGLIESRPKLGQFPYMAAVGYNLSISSVGWICSGTLISDTFVLTAAHCTYSSQWGNPTWVRVGDLDLLRSDDGATPVDRRIVEIFNHPEYKRHSMYHDIALLRLESSVPFNVGIRPACLHTEPTTRTSNVIATGWGSDWIYDESSNYLTKIVLSIVDSKNCTTSFTTEQPKGVLNDSLICTETHEKDDCQGDSGGPLVIYNNKEYCMYDVVGITVRRGLCGSTVPGIYTRVYNYIPWIETIVWKQE